MSKQTDEEIAWEQRKTVGTVGFVGLAAVILATIFGG